MDPKIRLSIIFFLGGCFVAVTLQVYFFSPLSSPQSFLLPSSQSVFDSIHPPNSFLQEVIKIGEGEVKDPEGICVDKEGILYTAGRDGWIKRFDTKNGSYNLENWKWVNSSALLGMTITSAGDLIVCDAQQGLLIVNEDGVTVLVSHFNGSKLRLADDVVEAKDGSLYFSEASTKFGLHEWPFDMLEARPHGQLLRYNPQTKETSLVIDNLGFANGVTISSDNDYLVVCETLKYRCLKYWLQGELEGTTEIFIDNLPGAPDNINVAPDGSFWIAILQLMDAKMRFVLKSSVVRHVIATFPRVLSMITTTHMKATVIKVATNGTIMKRFDDPNGKVMAFVTSALEYDNNLYLGGLMFDFVGKLPLQHYS